MLKNTSTSYQQSVPAVARAALVLEQLAATPDPLSLAALSRAVGANPSSLLAVLTTLRGFGLVSKDGDGRYALGPGLAALGAAAARNLSALQVFQVVAERLAARVGETVLLWMPQGDTFLLVAAREGTQPLRFVPTPGLRIPAATSGMAGLALRPHTVGEVEPLPGVCMLAHALPGDNSADGAILALAGPPGRLRDAPGAARRALQTAIDEIAPNRTGEAAIAPNWENAGPIDPRELDAFLGQSLVATLSYVADDGYPATLPLWYAWDGRVFWLAPRPGAEWAEHVRLDPRVSLAISESEPPLRRVLVRGRAEPLDSPTGEQWRAVTDQLAARYVGCDATRHLAPRSDQPRQLLRLVPERLIAWRGLLRHPRLSADSGSADVRYFG
jgi:PPOX class probable F420-dependent enzyme